MKALAIFGRSGKPVTYEVRLEVDTAIVSDYDDWLRDHVREMLAFPGFQTATVYRGHDLTGDHRAVRVVTYGIRSRRELDSYLHTHAARMRKEGAARFGNRFSASRRILKTAEYALPEGLAVLYAPEDISGGLPVCANCHQPVPGRFCVNCGQEDRTFMLSLGELAYDFVGDIFNFDSRFFRTLRPLLFRPGLLTTEYVRGRRQLYLPPVRTYIFISLIFFFCAALVTDREFGDEFNDEMRNELGIEINDEPIVIAPGRDLSPEERAKAEQELREAAATLGLRDDALRLPGAPADDAPEADSTDASGGMQAAETDDTIFGINENEFEDRVEHGADVLKEDPRAFVQEILRQLPTMMFVFLPLIALVLQVLYIGSRRYYVEHLIFTLHFHSAVFVLLLLWLLFGILEKAWSPLLAFSSWITAAIWIYVPVYLYLSMRRVYGQGHFFTTLKYILLFFAYVASMTATLVFTLVYTLYQQT